MVLCGRVFIFNDCFTVIKTNCLWNPQNTVHHRRSDQAREEVCLHKEWVRTMQRAQRVPVKKNLCISLRLTRKGGKRYSYPSLCMLVPVMRTRQVGFPDRFQPIHNKGHHFLCCLPHSQGPTYRSDIRSSHSTLTATVPPSASEATGEHWDVSVSRRQRNQEEEHHTLSLTQHICIRQKKLTENCKQSWLYAFPFSKFETHIRSKGLQKASNQFLRGWIGLQPGNCC